MCPPSHSHLLIYVVIKSLSHTHRVEGNVLDKVSNAGNPLSLISYDKNLHSAYFMSGTFLSTL